MTTLQKIFGAREQAADNQPCIPLSSRCARGIPVHPLFLISTIRLYDGRILWMQVR